MITTTWTAPSADLLGTGSADVRTAGRRRVCLPPNERFIAPTYLPQHDGTTLGIHRPGRPQS